MKTGCRVFARWDCKSIKEVVSRVVINKARPQQSGQIPVSRRLESPLTSLGLGFPEEVQEVTQGAGQTSKAGRHVVALSSDYLVTNTEIFQNFHNRRCHTDAAFVALSIAFISSIGLDFSVKN